MSKNSRLLFTLVILILLVQACNMPGNNQPPTETFQPPTALPTLESPPTEPPAVVQHQVFPVLAPDSKLLYDVDSSSTGSEKRAPYGDSYDINRLERPFLQDMTYIADLDIRAFSLSEDADWYYLSIGLVGTDPNNPMGINYGVELDMNMDGFGDFLIQATPPYMDDWTADNVRIYADQNLNSAGLSSARSDVPFQSDGYEALIFDSKAGVGDDPDVAWVRINAGTYATVQFAFKKSWAGDAFMYGVFSDAGLKDVTKLDYVDRFTEQEAGSPVRDKKYYPLQALFAVDNTCQEVIGFTPTGYEPKLCPRVVPATHQPGERLQPTPGQAGCPDPGGCTYGWVGEPYCMCVIG